MRTTLTLLVLGSLFVAGCKGSDDAAQMITTSTFHGSVSAASFPAAPTAVDATDEKGGETRSLIDSQGAFTLVLGKSHSYRLSVVTPGASVPVVFPRSASQVDAGFTVSKGAARVDLGALRYYPQAPSGGFMVLRASAETCGDGVTAAGRACVSDMPEVSCDQGPSNDPADGECVDGTDKTTGKACADGDNVGDPPDLAAPLATAEHNAPSDVSGCSDGDGEDAADLRARPRMDWGIQSAGEPRVAVCPGAPKESVSSGQDPVSENAAPISRWSDRRKRGAAGQ